jgi:hypothetical protein
MFDNFIYRIRQKAQEVIEQDPLYLLISQESRQDSPGGFEEFQRDVLKQTMDLSTFLMHYAHRPWKNSLKRVASAMLLDPFLYLERRIIDGMNGTLSPCIFALPWVLASNFV